CPCVAPVRACSRFGQFLRAAVAILAGFGLTLAERRFERKALAIGILALLAVNLEALRPPINSLAFEGISPVFDGLAKTDRALVARFPFPPRREAFHNVDCMLASTRF